MAKRKYPKHLIEQRTRQGVTPAGLKWMQTKEVAACSNVSFYRMVSDPAKVTCQRCRESNIFARVSNAA